MLMGLLQSPLSFMRKDERTERETYESLRDDRVIVSLNEPLLGRGSELEMSLSRRSLEILRTCNNQKWLARLV